MSEAPPPVPDAPPRVPAPRPMAPQDHFRILEAFKDNIEAFTIALVMALVIKHFCVEAFKIPTGSMEPTLLGEKNNDIGDRILVDKLAYLFREPQRWDVIVFRFPLNKSKHFIKRVAGIGGESLRIRRGDIWVRRGDDQPWRIATKPRSVREELYLPVFPVQMDPGPSSSPFWDAGDRWRIEATDRLRFVGGEPSTVRLLKKFGRYSSNGWEGVRASGSMVRDLRFRMRLRPEGRGETILRWRAAEDEEVEVRLAPTGDAQGSFVAYRRPGRSIREELDVRLDPGQSRAVELELVDGWIHVHVDGRELAALDEQRDIAGVREYDDFTQELEIEASGGALDVEGFSADRDLYYERSSDMDLLEEGELGMRIPERHYFVLGDNTGASHDSRKWELYYVPLEDGREIVYYYDTDDRPVREGGTTRVVDRDGLMKTWNDADVVSPPGVRTDRAPFVPRDLVVGRAFLVFWPVFPSPPGRFGFIR